MSDPTNQRADGCSVFFTFLVLALLLSGFYLAQRIFEPDSPASVTEKVDSARREKASAYRTENSEFLSKVDSFHSDRNGSLEKSMIQVVNEYNKPSPALPTKSK